MRYRDPHLWVIALLMLVMTTSTVSGRYRVDNTIISDKKVLDGLLNKTHYDKRQRPPAPSETISSDGSPQTTESSSKCANATTVYANVVVLSLFSPDESSLKYEVEFLMHQHWRDYRLSFEDHHLATHYEYLNGIHHQDDIWIPDTYFVKHGDFKQLQLPSNIALRIFRDGSVTYTIRRLLSLACEGDLNIFPFDFPKCSFAMESVSYERHEMVYRWKESDRPPLYFLPDMHLLNAYIIGNETTDRCDDRLPWRGNYSCLKVHMVFTRDRSFYFSTVFIPGMLLVTSSFITFWLEWNAVPGRVMLGVTTMLNFFTTSNNFRSNLPVVSNLTAMNVWDGVCMCFIYASLLEFVTVNYLGRKKPRPLRCYRPVSTASTTTKPNTIKDEVGRASNENSSNICTSCLPGSGQAEKRVPRQEAPSSQTALTPTSGSTQQPINTNRDNIGGGQGQPTGTPYLDLAHPLRVAKTIDVVSRVVFPVAYGVFLIFFFARYSGFS